MSVGHAMTKCVSTCTPDDSLRDAVRVMEETQVGSLVVVAGDGSGRVVGLLTHRDVCGAAARTGETLDALPVSRAVSAAVPLCRQDDPLIDALEVMEGARVRRLPVVDHAGHLLGLISLSDVARAAVCESGPAMPALSSREVCRALAGDRRG